MGAVGAAVFSAGDAGRTTGVERGLVRRVSRDRFPERTSSDSDVFVSHDGGGVDLLSLLRSRRAGHRPALPKVSGAGCVWTVSGVGVGVPGSACCGIRQAVAALGRSRKSAALA